MAISLSGLGDPPAMYRQLGGQVLCMRDHMRAKPMRRAISLTLTLALLGGITSVQAAEVYKWKDGNKVTTYSQLPPARGVQAQRLRTNGSDAQTLPAATTGPTASTSGNGGASGQNEAAPAGDSAAQKKMRDELNAQEKVRLAKVAQERQGQCVRARAQFDQLTQRARMRVQEANGTVRVLPEEERQSLINEAKARVLELCTS